MANQRIDPDTILYEVLAAIQEGCPKGFKVSDQAQQIFRRRYRESIQKALNDGLKWTDEVKKAVLAVAHQHGVIAAAIASIHHTRDVNDVTMIKASHLVEMECHAHLEQHNKLMGQWCW